MSTELKSHAKDVTLTRFWGGSAKGSCVQVTQPNPNYDTDAGGPMFSHVQLTRSQAAAMAADLMDFAQGREQEDI
jgi:hypothetical protein|tara:strand:+ start:846 stop:1070 length:225 start_codon:yes stop_codon:yes gene_type:complete